MRTYGRVRNPQTGQFVPDPVTGMLWREVVTDANGYNDLVYATTLCQVFQLNLNESPFYGNYGLPAEEAVIQQVQPDFYVSRTQQQFAGYFANLIIWKDSAAEQPTYNANITTNQGAKILLSMAVPQ